MRLRWFSFFTFSSKKSANLCFSTSCILYCFAMLGHKKWKQSIMKYFYRKFRVHKQMLLWVLLLFKERKVDEELWNVDDFLEVKVILTSEQRVGTFGLKGHFENLITKWQRIRCLQTFTVGGGARKRVKMKQILTQWFSLYIWTFQNVSNRVGLAQLDSVLRFFIRWSCLAPGTFLVPIWLRFRAIWGDPASDPCCNDPTHITWYSFIMKSDKVRLSQATQRRY